jgi:hydroxypyruvate reductase
MIEPREFLTRLFHSGVEAADPRRATRQAVSEIRDLASSSLVIAAGKGAHAMASGALDALRQRGATVTHGLVVAHEPDASASHGLDAVEGDHPLPAERSLAAADGLSSVVSRSDGDEDALVLISGGATSLIAAPVAGLSTRDLRAAFESLLASGADITVMNAVRKRLLRFGAGRLALALRSRRVHCLIASDVVGNDVASIASGPCVPDSGSASEARARARDAGAWTSLPGAVRQIIDAMADGAMPDSPPADHPRFRTTDVRIIIDRNIAVEGVVKACMDRGAVAQVIDEPLTGEAAIAGDRIAAELLKRKRNTVPECVVWSGETTVSLKPGSGPGGRCQELALACARRLADVGPTAVGVTVLAAGTDGRDGPTDSAGAVVESTTWSRIRRAGVDPGAALRDHSSYGALEAAGALLKTGPTGTNVNDLVIGLIVPKRSS